MKKVSGTPSVGGQAVVEGVMMRAPRAATVAVRRPDGSIIVRVRSSSPMASRWPILGKPGLRGMLVLVETMADGISALNFSAEHAMEQGPGGENAVADGSMSRGAIGVTLAVSMVFGFALFAALPHFLTWGLGVLVGSESLKSGTAASFHLVDGAIKLAIFLAYIWLVSLMKDMRRVFEYHGAEHQAIFTWESGRDLTPENLAGFTTFHPRCGTAFLVTVIAVSIFVFVGVFPLLGQISTSKIVNQLAYLAIKLPLILPIGAISYEVIKLANRYSTTWFGRFISAPGLLMQRITTRRPDRPQQEIAVVALRSALDPERAGVGGGVGEKIMEFADYGAFIDWVSLPRDAATAAEVG